MSTPRKPNPDVIYPDANLLDADWPKGRDVLTPPKWKIEAEWPKDEPAKRQPEK